MVRSPRRVSPVGGAARVPASWLEKFDPAAAIRGAWRGFAVLLLGGLTTPIIAAYFPRLGAVWLPLTAVAAFVVAAWNAGSSADLRWYGLISSVCAYLLVLPLVLLHPDGRSPMQIASTLALAVVVGIGTGALRSARSTAGESHE